MSDLLKDWEAFIDVGNKVAKPNERWLLANGTEIVQAMMAQRGVSVRAGDAVSPRVSERHLFLFDGVGGRIRGSRVGR